MTSQERRYVTMSNRPSGLVTSTECESSTIITSNHNHISDIESAHADVRLSVVEVDPAYLHVTTSQRRSDTTLHPSLRAIAREYDIQMEMARHLQKLEDFEIVIVCDDSGSMKTPVDGTERTRWDELRRIVKIVLEIGVIFDSNGVDIHFLNRGVYEKIKDPKQVDDVFGPAPTGYTPLVPVVKKIFESLLANRQRDKKLLVFIATDGIPTDDDGNPNVPELEHLMRRVRNVETTYVTFLLCTDDPACVTYLNEWDESMRNVDVTDDFDTERRQIRTHRGPDFPFSFGDYVVKALVGAIDPEIDALDE